MRKIKLPRIVSIFLVFVVTSYNSVAQNLIAVQNGNSNSFYTTLDSAITHAQNGDTIYLPGGSFTVSNTINKPLCLIGAGYFTDSSITTGITLVNNITLKKGADNGSLEGLYINGPIQFGEGDTSESYVSNYRINRCYINGGIQFINTQGLNLSNNISVSECILMGANNSINGGPTGFITVSNNLIGGLIRNLNQSVVQNNIFLFKQQFYNG